MGLLHHPLGIAQRGDKEPDSFLQGDVHPLDHPLVVGLGRGLDQGIEAVRDLLNAILFPKMDTILSKRLYKHAKSQLQEVLQAKGISAPDYVVVGETGPDHDRQFTVKAVISGTDAATGTGKSKQLAQEAAAAAVLEDEENLKLLLGNK